MLVAGGYCIPNDDHDPPLFGYRLDANTVFNIQNSWFGTTFTFIAGFSGLAMNTWMIVSLFLRRKSTDSGKVASDTKDGEIKLLIFSSLVFLAFSLSVAIQTTCM
uniref:Uncharacterized protein n=1 Tax=Acrobeloides nanus TaxID=290746 RepID=A0A914E1A1_9BILA